MKAVKEPRICNSKIYLTDLIANNMEQGKKIVKETNAIDLNAIVIPTQKRTTRYRVNNSLVDGRPYLR